MNLRASLYAWRDSEAKARNIEGFRVLPNATLDAIVSALPRTRDELLAVKGIKDAKFDLYGRSILKIIAEHLAPAPVAPKSDPERFVSAGGVITNEQTPPSRPVLQVSQYIDVLNRELYRVRARIRGEVVSVQERGSAFYFTVKDIEQDAVLEVFMWSSDHRLSGVQLEAGLEIIIEGRAEIYKPTGRLKLRAESIELVGEGALKKAYDLLRKTLETEGLFAPGRKRSLPQFPSRIGVITSKQGAVIHDFLNNLGKFGFSITFIDARVEGVLAVKDIDAAMRRMKREQIDALVLIRGGGSLESLQAFNNEHIIRAVADFPVPVICAIGHDKDVPLAQLAADYAPSTPTACTALLNEPWVAAMHSVSLYEQDMFSAYRTALRTNELSLVRAQRYFEQAFTALEHTITSAIDDVLGALPLLARVIRDISKELGERTSFILRSLHGGIDKMEEQLSRYSALLDAHDPMRQLRLGYGILREEGRVLRSVEHVRVGATIDAMLNDGIISAKVINIEKNDEKDKTR